MGIDARKNKDQLDCASSLVPITKPDIFKQALFERIKTYVVPYLDGVDLKVIQDETDSTKGYVVYVIPKGENVYMSNKDKCYYRRSSSSFVKMEHWEIVDVFGRGKKPKLQLVIEKQTTLNENNEDEIKINFYIRNIGRAIAKHLMFIVQFQNAVYITSTGKMVNISSINNNILTFEFGHPGVALHPININNFIESITIKSLNKGPVIYLYTLCCEDMEPVQENIIILDPFPNSKKSFIDLEYGSQLKLLPKIPPISGREISQNDRAI